MQQLDLFQPVSPSSQERIMPPTKPVQHLAVTTKSIEQAIKLLKATGCQYKIIDAAGNEYGALQVAEKKKKRNGIYQYGELTNHFKPYVKDLEVGDVAVIPMDKFDYKTLIRCLSAWCNTQWGSGNTKTCRSGDTLQVLRCG